MGVTKTKRRSAGDVARGRRVLDAESDQNDFSMRVFVSRSFEVSLICPTPETSASRLRNS